MLHMSREEVAQEFEVEQKFLLTGVCTHNVVHVRDTRPIPTLCINSTSRAHDNPPPPHTHTHKHTHSCVQVEQKTEWPSRLRI
jgi:hypothetical protein